MNLPDLHGERIDLIEINESGLNDMYEYSQLPSFYTYLEYGEHKTIEETRQYLNKLINRSNSETDHYWFIYLKAERKVIGTFGLLNIDYRRGCTEIGYGLSPLYWGKGYFKESVILILNFLFNEMTFHRVWAKTQLNNIASIKVLEKVGFKKEGVMRDYYFSLKDGKYYDAAILGIIVDEFNLKELKN